MCKKGLKSHYIVTLHSENKNKQKNLTELKIKSHFTVTAIIKYTSEDGTFIVQLQIF